MGYQLFSDMTADVSEALMRGMPEVAYVPMQVELGGESFTYGPGGSLAVLRRAAGGQVCQHLADQPDDLSQVL